MSTSAGQGVEIDAVTGERQDGWDGELEPRAEQVCAVHLPSPRKLTRPQPGARAESGQPCHEEKTTPCRPQVAGEGHGEEPQRRVVTRLRESPHRPTGGQGGVGWKGRPLS